VASTGLHGANRLASNSLLEAVVMGARVGEALSREPALTVLPVIPAPNSGSRGSPWLETDTTASSLANRLRETMWSGAGLERTASGLREALDEIEELRRTSTAARIPEGELANMILVGRLVLRAAMARTESRGAHYRADFPYPSPCWRQELLIDGETLRPPRPVSIDRVATG
jgi:L-aspartate oxidase